MAIKLLIYFPAGSVGDYLPLLDTITTELMNSVVHFTLVFPDSDFQLTDMEVYEAWYKSKLPELWNYYRCCTVVQKDNKKYDAVIFITQQKFLPRIEAELAKFDGVAKYVALHTHARYYCFYPKAMQGLGRLVKGLPAERTCLHYYYSNYGSLYDELKGAVQSLHVQW